MIDLIEYLKLWWACRKGQRADRQRAWRDMSTGREEYGQQRELAVTIQIDPARCWVRIDTEDPSGDRRYHRTLIGD